MDTRSPRGRIVNELWMSAGKTMKGLGVANLALLVAELFQVKVCSMMLLMTARAFNLASWHVRAEGCTGKFGHEISGASGVILAGGVRQMRNPFLVG